MKFFNNKVLPYSAPADNNTTYQHHEIIEIPGNIKGNDYFATDPHGHHDVLVGAIETLGKHDRLFLCGDIIDRGPESLKNIQYINQYNQGKTQKQIMAIRGNHEDYALKTEFFIELIDAIQKRENTPEAWLQFKNTEANTWLKNLNASELMTILQHAEELFKFARETPWENSVEFKSKVLSLRNHCLENLELEKQQYIFNDAWQHIANGGGWLFSLDKTERLEVKDFVQSLPYMIRIGQAKRSENTILRVDIVHAAPLDQTAIQEILNNKRALTAHEISYMTTARFSEHHTIKIDNQNRNKYSVLTIVGHSPFGMINRTSNYQSINVINLDVGTYDNGNMLLLNYTEKNFSLYKPSKSSDNNFIHRVIGTINHTLQYHRQTEIEEYTVNKDCILATSFCL